MPSLTVQEAARTTGWSARMLRYLESLELVVPPRSAAGYRLYGPAELQRLRTLRTLLDLHGLTPSDVALAQRVAREPETAAALTGWLEASVGPPAELVVAGSGSAVDEESWLAWEQAKQEQLLRG